MRSFIPEKLLFFADNAKKAFPKNQTKAFTNKKLIYKRDFPPSLAYALRNNRHLLQSWRKQSWP